MRMWKMTMASVLAAVWLAGCGSTGGAADTTAPTFTSSSSVSVAENTTAVLMITTDDPNALLTLSGTDSALFELNVNALLFKIAPDYESPQDSGGDNVYNVTVTATDTAGNAAQQQIAVTVTDVNETVLDVTPPHFTSPSSVSVAENTLDVLMVTTDDPTAVLILSGVDAALFDLNTSGELRFKTAPDYENPQDSGYNNAYNVTVSATDAAANSAEQYISITVTDVAEQTAVTVKKTGQTKSYDQSGNEVTDGSVKDDGYYQKGVDHNYTRDDVKEIVTDNVTGLMWQDDANASSVGKRWLARDKYWTCDDNTSSPACDDTSGDTAATYCENLTLGGYTDWRLPNINELKSIVDRSSRGFPEMKEGFVNSGRGYYWSGTARESEHDVAWNFYSGRVNFAYKYDSCYVRCVRGGQ